MKEITINPNTFISIKKKSKKKYYPYNDPWINHPSKNDKDFLQL